MADSTARALRLLSMLQNRRYWGGAELADRLGVSVRTLRRDVDRLRELGYPVRARPGVDGGYELSPGAVLPPLVLDDDEAVALTVGLQAAAQSPVAGTAEASLRALAKVVQVLPARLRRRVDALRAVTVPAAWTPPRPEIDPEALTAVAQACRDTERLRFAYTTASGEAAQRFVEPFRLVSLGRRWYLVAFDLDRGDWRSFRLDRLTDPGPTGARFAPRTLPGGDAAEFVRAGITSRQGSHHVAAEVQAPADDVRARIGQWSTVEPTGAGSCRVRMEADDLSWPALALGMVGAEFTAISPPELRELLGEWGRRFSRATGGAPPTVAGPAAT